MTAHGRWICLAVVGVTATLAACSGGGGTPASTPTPTHSPIATPRAVPALPTPEIAGATYRFPAKGFAIDPPAGWTSVPNSVFDQVQSQFASDAFFAPKTQDRVQASISITCQKANPDQTTITAYRDARQAHIKLLAGVDAAARATTVAGEPAYAFDYAQAVASQGFSIDITDVIFLGSGCRWLVTLAAPAGARTRYAAAFEAALASMRLLPRPATTTPVAN